ncbi:hypothetical protein KTR66_20870 [Roseococcus sp. SDR]|uniref:hypothetical protein n=1 Tax=Roseococcus sp. SDR TaxID=2835532 RepID=UPI001BCC969D|nr:hypothetical protein [Roseococcus sp. SDR]MBS7792458.1 hypothetical protein [Roseococcus sp. SDR]MBV1847772.1 hypothetical protein [Roseococcus sp. SDR]
MNASRLLEIVERMRATEAHGGLQNLLVNSVMSSLQNLVSSPNSPQWQTSLRDGLTQLSDAQTAATKSLGPEDRKAFAELRGAEFLLNDLAEMVDGVVQANAATLQVAANELAPFIQRRADFLTGLDALSRHLRELGLEEPPLEAGEAELGIRLPRTVFSNSLDGLQQELKTINRIIRAVSEAVSGSPDTAEVRRISTSDPLFTLGLPLATILAIGKLVTWGLGVWKQVEDIRLVRAQTRKLDIENSAALAEMYEKAIEKKVNGLVEAKVREMLGVRYEEAGRAQEQRTDLTQVLGILLDQLQKGITIEVRLGPPPPEQADGEREDEQGRVRKANYAELAEVRQKLLFPTFSDEPLKFLAKPANDDAAQGTSEDTGD